ncbi:MAG TPA: peptidoglycan -binding protein [Stellaceae bacterium]|jgi:chemotaxis protein MotB|nr:peptidoglycan -binding protein [Stellaceae bacterium]
MAFSSRRQRRENLNIWPGFVDALTQLVMIIIFVVLVFTAGQFYLSSALSGRNAELAKLTERINALSNILAMERKSSSSLQLQLATLSDQLAAAKTALAKSQADLAKASTAAADTAKQQQALQTQLGNEVVRRKAAEEDIAQRDDKLHSQQSAIDLLNQQLAALQKQLQEIQAALDLSESKNKAANVQIADLGRRLNVALANKVAELAGYRSEFFGRLRQLLGNRSDIRVVGDRFLFESEVLFPKASADLTPEAVDQLVPLANALKEIEVKIPPDINWILQVDGHTDRHPINTPQFKSNWELSTARAVSVVKFLIDQGIPANRLSAAGYGEFQPVDTGASPEAFKRNRRIELKLTAR